MVGDRRTPVSSSAIKTCLVRQNSRRLPIISFSRSVSSFASDSGGMKLDARNNIGSAANDRQQAINAVQAKKNAMRGEGLIGETLAQGRSLTGGGARTRCACQ